MISAIDSIIIAGDAGNAADEPFKIIEDGDYDNINARVVVQAYIIDEIKDNIPGMDDGINIMEFKLKYNTSSNKWEILSIVTKYTGNA